MTENRDITPERHGYTCGARAMLNQMETAGVLTNEDRQDWIIAYDLDPQGMVKSADELTNLEGIMWRESWENGACAVLGQLKKEGKISSEEHLQYLKENWL